MSAHVIHHERRVIRKCVLNTDCQPLAHAILEVAANGIGGSLTDPREVYVLRWIAGRRAGRPEFNPLYTIS